MIFGGRGGMGVGGEGRRGWFGLILGFWDLQRDLEFRKNKFWLVTLTFSCMWLDYLWDIRCFCIHWLLSHLLIFSHTYLYLVTWLTGWVLVKLDSSISSLV